MAIQVHHRWTVPIMWVVVLSSGCGIGESGPDAPSEMDRRPASYLSQVVPPCVEVDGLVANPCPRDLFVSSREGEVSDNYTATTQMAEPRAYTTRELLIDLLPFEAGYIVVRGSVLPKSTRCGVYDNVLSNFRDKVGWAIIESSVGDIHDFVCFQELSVNEYIVGTGPRLLTVANINYAVYLEEGETWADVKDEWLKDRGEHPKARAERRYEGREMVLFLKPAHSLRVEAWTAEWWYMQWFVQKVGDEVRAVNLEEAVFRGRDEETYGLVNRELSEFVAEIREVAATRSGLYGGRIGRDSTLPKLVTDANKLQEFYVAAGAVYEGEGKTTVLPPPPPDDFVPPSTTVASSTTSSSVSPSSTTSVGSTSTTVLDPSSTTSSTAGATTTTSTVVAETTTTLAPTTTSLAPTTTSSVVTTTSSSTTTVASSTTTVVAAGPKLSVSDAEGTEGETLEFVISLSEDPYDRVVVNYDVEAGTAQVGVDVHRFSGTALFDPFEVRKVARVPTIRDSEKEGTETFNLVLSEASGAPIEKSVGVGTILDDD